MHYNPFREPRNSPRNHAKHPSNHPVTTEQQFCTPYIFQNIKNTSQKRQHSALHCWSGFTNYNNNVILNNFTFRWQNAKCKRNERICILGDGEDEKKKGEGRENSMKWGVWNTYPLEWCCSTLLRLSLVLNVLFILLCSCLASRLRCIPDSRRIQTPALHSGAIRQALNLYKHRDLPRAFTTCKHHLFKVIQITGHPHPVWCQKTLLHMQGHLITPVQIWMWNYEQFL